MIKLDNTEKRCFVACNKETIKNNKCSCILKKYDFKIKILKIKK